MVILQLNNITKSFDVGKSNKINILENVSLDINEHDFVIILGVSGVGKSTLMRLITGEIFPDNGSIYFNRKNITKLPAFKRANFLTQISQLRENNLPSTLTISEVLSLAQSANKSMFSFLETKEERISGNVFLTRFKSELSKSKEEQIRVLSGGEHQIISLISAFQIIKNNSLSKKLLLLDEHISNLDFDSAKMLMKKTNELIIEHSLTSIMVTHNLEIALNYGNRLIILKNRKIAFDKSYKPNESRDLLEIQNSMLV